MASARGTVAAVRRTGRVLVSAPWRRAPLQVLRSPSLAIGVTVAAFVLGLAGASRPLFSASAGKASLAQDLTDGCAYEVGFRAQRGWGVTEIEQVDGAARTLDRALALVPGLAPTVRTTFVGDGSVAPAGEDGPGARVQLIERDGFRGHIDVVAEGDGPGLWLPDVVAEPAGLGPGDTVTVTTPTGTDVDLPVAGVARDLRAERDTDWCSMPLVFEAPSAGGSEPPPVALVDGLDVGGLVRDLELGGVGVWFEAPPDPEEWDLATAEEAVPRLRTIADQSNDGVSELAVTIGAGPTSVDRPESVEKARSALTSVESVAGPVAWGTIGVALTMLLTAARSWLSRRSQQVTVLTLRGAGPAVVALKAIGELLPALSIGAGAGVAAALGVVRGVGPDPGIEGGALVEGLVVVALAGLAALVAVAAVVATGARRVGVGAGGAAPPRNLLPWEPVVLAGAAAALYEVQSRPPSSDGTIDGLLLVFPLLLLAGGAGAATRLLLSRRVLALVADRAPAAGWLAARRLTTSRSRVALIVTGAAISIGIVVFSGATSQSVRATADAKALLGDGARQIVRLASRGEELPTEPPLPDSTLVTRTTESEIIRRGHDRADVLGVEPDSFAAAAFWDETFAERPLASLLASIDLDEVRPGEVPVVAVGAGLPERFVVTLRGDAGRVEIRVRVVARARWFPGLGSQRPRPLVVIDRSVLSARGVIDHPEVWLADDDPDLPGRLADDGLTVVYSRRGAAAVVGTRLQPQVWAIDYLRIVGLAAGLVTVAGLGLHFAADAERRRLGAALARRLGLPARAVTGATVVEVGLILLSGVVLGVGLAWLAVRLVFRQLDPIPATEPDPLLRYDPGLALACVVTAVVVAVVVTLVVERRSARSSLPELLRAAR